MREEARSEVADFVISCRKFTARLSTEEGKSARAKQELSNNALSFH